MKKWNLGVVRRNDKIYNKFRKKKIKRIKVGEQSKW